jgi:hypothetical protein
VNRRAKTYDDGITDTIATLIVGAGIVGILFLLGLMQAQFCVWGLSLFGVSTGIWGPYILIGVFEGVLTTSMFTWKMLNK